MDKNTKISKDFQNTAIVFSGGSTNGFCYLGVLKYLEEHSIKPVLVGGTSAGSLFAAIVAAGYTYDEALEYSIELESKIGSMKDFAFGAMWKALLRFDLDLFTGLIKGNKIHKEIQRLLKNKKVTKFPEFKLPFFLHAINIENGNDVLASSCNKNYAHHNAADWIRASISMPGIFCPAKIDGKHYVDGAARCNYPILSAAEIGHNAGIKIDKVISVSIEDDFLDDWGSNMTSFLDILARTAKLTLHDQYCSDHDLFREKHPEIELIEVRIPKIHKATDTNVDVIKLAEIGYGAIALHSLI